MAPKRRPRGTVAGRDVLRLMYPSNASVLSVGLTRPTVTLHLPRRRWLDSVTKRGPAEVEGTLGRVRTGDEHEAADLRDRQGDQLAAWRGAPFCAASLASRRTEAFTTAK